MNYCDVCIERAELRRVRLPLVGEILRACALCIAACERRARALLSTWLDDEKRRIDAEANLRARGGTSPQALWRRGKALR